MTPLRQWLKPPRTLLLALVLLTLVSVSMLAWFGWRLFEQQRIVEQQRSLDRLEQIADRAVATLRSAFAESGERLADWDSVTPRGDEVLLLLNDAGVQVKSTSRLLYYPTPGREPQPNPAVFSEGELFEFTQNEPAEALRVYQRLAQSRDPAIRAGALLRMARVLRRSGNTEEARAAYRRLASISNVRIADTPADLVARFEISALSSERAGEGAGERAGETARDRAGTNELRSDLLAGTWHLTRGQFDFYWSELAGSEPPPTTAIALAEAVESIWDNRTRDDEPRGQKTLWISGLPFFVQWRGAAERRVAMLAKPDSFFREAFRGESIRFAAIDAGGRTVVGERNASLRAVVRTAGDTQLPWTLYVSAPQSALMVAFAAQQRFLLLGISVMALFLILGTYFIARAIRKETEAARMQSDFVSVVSHEFRSPLTSMRQLSEILALGRVPTEERRQLYYETLVKETTRLQRLVEALLNFGRMEAGARQYRFEEVDAGQVIRRVAADFEAQIADSGRRIELSGAESGCTIEVDSDAISVALRNLVDNAVKYSPECPTVWIEWKRQDELVAIQVRDRGRGITTAERKAIFRKFVRGSAAASTNAKGSGVGLAMVRHIVTAHGGQIVVASEPGQGSAFTILLPSAERL